MSTRKKEWLLLFVGMMLLNGLVFGWQTFSQTMTNSVDSLYHIRYAREYWLQGFFGGFPWMQYSVARDIWADHHFLYHLLLIPFTFGDLFRGMQWSAVVFSSLACTSCVLYLKAHKVRYSWVYGILLLCSSSMFLFRVSMPRAMSLCILFLMLSLWALEKKKDRWLLPIGFVFIWTYQTAVVLLPMSVCAVLMRGLTEKDWTLKPFIYASLGILLGLTLNPFFPNSWKFFFWHLISGHVDTKVAIGGEWHAMTGDRLLKTSGPALFLGFVVPLLLVRRRREWPKDIWLLAIGTFVLFVAAFRANRMLEYGVPFAVLLGARLIDAMFFRENNESNESKLSPAWVKWSFLGLFLLCLPVGVFYHYDLHKRAYDIKPQSFQKTSLWLKKNTPKHSIVFHTRWDVFPYLYFYNADNYYITGLNPHFLQSWNPKLYRLYRLAALGRVKDPVKVIQKNFRADYVLLYPRREDQLLMLKLEYHPLAKRVFGAGRREARIYRLFKKKPTNKKSKQRTPSIQKGGSK